MGQSSSSTNQPKSVIHLMDTVVRSSSSITPSEDGFSDHVSFGDDFISNLPDECLALIFHYISSGDRKSCSLVCRRWLLVEGQSRQRLSINATTDLLLPNITSLFNRFDSVTKLALRCDRRSISLDDEALTQISLRCRNLTRLKLRGCREITHLGMSSFAQNCKGLKKFSCGSCTFGVKGINAVLQHCLSLEELSVKRLRGIGDGANEAIGCSLTSLSLRSIYLKELYNGQCFAPLITGAMNLRTLKLIRCLGDWDSPFQMIGARKNTLVEIHLEKLQLSDGGLASISNCLDLEILHLVKTPECTNVGIVSVAEKCKLLRKLHIDGWRTNRIGNEGLMAIAKHSMNLQELVLIGVNPNSTSLDSIASNCTKLERLALCGSETIGDAEVSCIAAKCKSLKKFCIKGCPITDYGIEAFAWGCPNLVKIKVKKCRGVTGGAAERLRVRRGSLVVNMDAEEAEVEGLDASASDSGAQEEGPSELPQIVNHQVHNIAPTRSSFGRSSSSSVFKSRFSLFACTFRR